MAVKKVAVDEERLRDYEMVLVLSPDVAEDSLEAVLDKISQVITEKGGTVSAVERWGRRKLAYPIKQFMEGSYVLARFTLNTMLAKELEASLRISEAVLRHLLVRLEG